jgi:hypothetical protein
MRRLVRHHRPLLLRAVAVATMLAFGLASVGFPIWSPGEGKDLSTPFPCMHRQCGCRNAEQCWQGCCCFTNQQKIAWARERGVSLPDYVVAAAAQESKVSSVASSCCSAKSKACCEPSNSEPGSISAHDCRDAVTDCRDAVTKRAGQITTVSIVEALTCQGHVEQWVAAGAIQVADALSFDVEILPAGLLPVTSERATSLRPTPLDPPPCC